MGAKDRIELDRFFNNPVDRPTLGLMYGRRRVGKSTMLVEQVVARGGFYYEATRVETPVQLERLGRALGEYLKVGRVALESWDEAVDALLRLGNDGALPVILDEFGYIIEADFSVDSVLASAFGPGASRDRRGKARVVLCGSAVALMRALTSGEAPLRGRASMELVVQSDDYRVAATRLPSGTNLEVAPRVYAVIGGVVGYATDMVGYDLPDSAGDFDRWVNQRVLSSAATLHHEATTFLAEDPTFAGRGSLQYRSVLGSIANGSVTAGSIANQLGKSVSNLAPALNRLVDAGFIVRHEDPVRAKRPTYTLNDSFLQFHYAILEPHGAELRDRDPIEVWERRLRHVFDSRVRGPVFEEQARTWVRRFSSDVTLEVRDHVGPSSAIIDSVVHELDVVVSEAGESPSERRIVAIGEAKASETLSTDHLRRLERARSSFGSLAMDAKLLLFGITVDGVLRRVAASREDVEIIDLDRLYAGS